VGVAQAHAPEVALELVVLDDEAAAMLGPGDQRRPVPRAEHGAGRGLMGRCDHDDLGLAARQRADVDAFPRRIGMTVRPACSTIRRTDFPVTRSDPQGFDGDGIGCES
jgi:hypothetical protein